MLNIMQHFEGGLPYLNLKLTDREHRTEVEANVHASTIRKRLPRFILETLYVKGMMS